LIGVDAENVIHTTTQGLRTVDPEGTPQNIETDSTFAIYSMTKLMTCISAMQCVERGLLKLDDDIGDVLPYWKNVEVIKGVDSDGKLTLQKAKNKITLRQVQNLRY
jgi:CubicO group peptidase (beta-lactamase class C family)